MLLVLSIPSGLLAQTKSSAPLTKVIQVRRLNQKQAEQALPIHLDGVVTDVSGRKFSFFMQDSTAGIYVEHTDHVEVHLGDRIEVIGASSVGQFAPVVRASFVHVTGQAPLPRTRRVQYRDLIGGAQDSQRIEVEGVVHSVRSSRGFGHDTVLLNLDLGEGFVTVTLQDFAGIDYTSLIDANVRVRGVCNTIFNAKRQFVGLGISVPDSGDLDVVKLAAQDLFAGASIPVRKSLQFDQKAHRVEITGVSTYQIPGRGLYLQDGNDGILVQSTSKVLIAPGRLVEAVGFPKMGEFGPILEDAFFREDGAATPISPLRIDAGDVITGKPGYIQAPYDLQLVQLKGEVVENQIRGDQRVWILKDRGQIFDAYLPLSVSADNIQHFGTGSVLLVTGVCTVHSDTGPNPASFAILLRSPQDIAVLEEASWWTPAHNLFVLSTLLGVVILVALWVILLRNRVGAQTRVIRESEERFRDLAEHDVLTGLPNRLMLEHRIVRCLEGCKANGLWAVVFTVDIDRFKQINDTYGHPAGDECLKVVALRLRNIVRRVDTIARTGGEEFTIVVGNLPNPESAQRISSNILALFHDPVVLLDQEIKLSVSVGGALYPEDGLDFETLRKGSDQALFEAKRTGRNCAVFVNPALCASIESVTAIERALREALQKDGFQLHYQPICDAEGVVRRLEALLRATDKTLAALGPAKFIPVAEATGLIIPLGRWVLLEACRQIAEWRSLGMDPCPVAVNISGQQLTHVGFAEEVLEILQQFNIPPRLLELELTETTIMTDLASVAETVAQLSQVGITFAIDDFGTGYSSLSRLDELPIKALKIDRSFVESLDKKAGSRTIILAIIQMANSLNLQVIAEGVETENQFNVLRELGCQYFQGYLFARPLSAELLMKTLGRNRGCFITESSSTFNAA